MTQEDKQLLLVDLCARLPYCVIGSYSWKNREPYNRELTGCLFDELKSSWDSTGDSQFSPYLRPLSSMTVEEQLEFTDAVAPNGSVVFCNEFVHVPTSADFAQVHLSRALSYGYLARIIDWLNTHHFDYRGLIDKGLAIEVTKENNPYKD